MFGHEIFFISKVKILDLTYTININRFDSKYFSFRSTSSSSYRNGTQREYD